jgi:hypothetical protein
VQKIDRDRIDIQFPQGEGHIDDILFRLSHSHDAAAAHGEARGLYVF